MTGHNLSAYLAPRISLNKRFLSDAWDNFHDCENFLWFHEALEELLLEYKLKLVDDGYFNYSISTCIDRKHFNEILNKYITAI